MSLQHISDDMNYILSQIEKQDGLQSRDDEEIIRTLWNKRELAYRQLQEYDVQFQELHINDHNITDGLKVCFHWLISELNNFRCA